MAWKLRIVTWLVILISVFTQYPNYDEPCIPNVQFRNCLASKTTKNHMWNIQKDTNLFINAEILSKCVGSVLRVQWLLVNKATGRIVKSLKKFRDKHGVYFPPNSLKPMEYILIARVTEQAFMVDQHTTDTECWIKVAEKRVTREHISPRANHTAKYKIELHLNSQQQGWVECSNPDIAILVSGTRKPMHTFFGELRDFDNWIYRRTWWIVGTWSWTGTFSATRTSKGGSTASFSKSSTYSTRADNTTGHVGYPLIDGKSFSGSQGIKLTFPLRIKNFPQVFEYIMKPSISYGRTYRFLICEDKDTYALGCANASTVTMCPSWAYQFSCKTTPKSPVKTTTMLTMKCKSEGTPPEGLKYGISTLVDTQYSKRPRSIRLAYSDKADEITARLFLLTRMHTIYLYLVDSKMQMIHRCDVDTPKCRAFYVNYMVTSSINGTSYKDKFEYLKKMKDGEKQLKKFSEVVGSENLGEAVQCAHILISELDFIEVSASDRTEFQGELLESFAEVKTFTWATTEMMIGILERFDLMGIAKEVFYAKHKSKVLKEICTVGKGVLEGYSAPMVVRWMMEQRYFPELYRQVSLLFDSDYVKPVTFSIKSQENVPYHIYRKEDYERYDDENDETLSADYSNVSDNAVQALKSVLFARSLVHYEYDYHIECKEHSVVSRIYIERGDTMYVENEVGSVYYLNLGDAAILTGNDTLRLIWSLLDKNAFFWHKEAAKFRTPYLLLNYYYDRVEKKEDFKKPPKAFLRLHGELEIRMHHDGVTVPNREDDWSRPKFINRFIRSYRILVTEDMKGSTFTLFLDNITKVARLRVIINTHDRRPRLDDFESNDYVKIDFNNKTKISHMIPVEKIGHWFIGILPYKEDIIALKSRRKRQLLEKLGQGEHYELVTYMFSAMRLACPVFEGDDFTYAKCKVSENSTVGFLACDCPEIGNPMGTIANALPYISYGILDIPVHLSLAIEYRIIGAIIIAIFFYCFLLVVAPYRTKSMELVCFLADNAKSNRYGYMVKVQTADFLNSGTTGYIGIKLFGTAGESKRHILNYPDPAHKFLNNGCVDRFLIANDRPLGILNRIEIWSDCSGYAPEWFCENIEVFDLQIGRHWYFAIQKRFGIEKNRKAHYFVRPNRANQVTVRSPWSHFSTHFGASHTWNMADASQDSEWLYIERVTVILSHIVTTFAVTLALIHPIYLYFYDGIGINNKPDLIFYVKYITIVTIICAPLNFIIAVIFRNCQKVGRFRGLYGYFPPFVHKWTWIWLILLVLTSTVYCVLCGPFIAYTVTYDWTIIVIASLAINIFLFENIFLAVYSLLKTGVLAGMNITGSARYQMKEIIADVENQRKYLYENTDKQGLRPHLTQLYLPLTGERLKKRRRECENRRGIASILANMIYMVFFAILLMFMIGLTHNNDGAGLNKHLEEMFIHGTVGIMQKGSKSVIFYQDIYDYMNKTLVDGLTGTVWYAPYTVNDVGMLPDFHNKYLGGARLRQKRVFPVKSCPMAIFVNFVWKGLECIPPYHEDHVADNSTYDLSVKHNKSMWHFHEDKRWNKYYGMLTTYDGDGYSLTIGKIRPNALYRVQIIYDNNWLDKRTKVVIIEMIIYNAYANLFTDFKVVFEREAQFIMPTFWIYTAELLHVSDAWHTCNMVVLLIFIFVTIRMFIVFVVEIFTYRMHFFEDSFRVTMMLITGINIAAITYFILRVYRVNKFLSDMNHKKRNHYFEYCHIFHVHRIMETLFALMNFMVCMLLLQFTKFVGFTMCLVKAIQKTLPSFFILFLANLNAMMCFGFMGNMIYGANALEYVSPVKSIILSLYLFARVGCTKTLWRKIGDFGPITIFIYLAILTVYAIIKVYYIVICMQGYHWAKIETSTDIYRYTLVNYIAESIMFMKQTIIRRFRFLQRNKRRRGGAPRRPPLEMVSPRVPKYRYKDKFQASELTLHKQRIIVYALLRNKFMRKHTDGPQREDFQLMKRIMRIRAIPDDMMMASDYYFTCRVPFSKKTRTSIIPNERLEAMAATADSILVSKNKKSAVTNTPAEVKFRQGMDLTQDQIDMLQSTSKDRTTQQLNRVYVVLDSTDAILDIVIKKVMEAWRAKKMEEVCCKY